MDYGAYLGSSSSDNSDGEGEGLNRQSQAAAINGEERIQNTRLEHAWL